MSSYIILKTSEGEIEYIGDKEIYVGQRCKPTMINSKAKFSHRQKGSKQFQGDRERKRERDQSKLAIQE